MTLSRHRWTSIPDGGRTDEAHIWLTEVGMRAFGSAVAPDYAMSWRLDAAEGWVTRELRVTVEALEWSRALVLSRDADGSWSSQTSSSGSAGLPAPGIADPGSLRSDQVYASSPHRERVRYRSLGRDFEAELLVDQDGIVVEYPTLARRLGQ